MSKWDWVEVQAGPEGEIIRFEEGEAVEGIVVSWHASEGIPSQYAKSGEVGFLSLQEEGQDEPVTVPLDGVMLKERVNMLKPQKGQPMRITFVEKRVAKRSGYGFKVWRVETASNWTPSQPSEAPTAAVVAAESSEPTPAAQPVSRRRQTKTDWEEPF